MPIVAFAVSSTAAPGDPSETMLGEEWRSASSEQVLTALHGHSPPAATGVPASIMHALQGHVAPEIETALQQMALPGRDGLSR